MRTDSTSVLSRITLFNRIYTCGAHHLPDSEQARARVINLLAMLAVVLSAFYSVLYGLVFGSAEAAVLNLLFVASYAGYFLFVRRGRIRSSRAWLSLMFVTQMAVFSLWVFSPQSGLHLFVIAGIPLVFVVLGHPERYLRGFFVVALIIIFLLAELLATEKLLAHLTPEMHRISYLTSVPVIGLLVAVVLQAFVVELHRRDDTLQHLTVTDQLTDVANRRGLIERAESLRSQAVRHTLPMCVVMLDIDHFKAVNDLHGHAIGDRLLVEVAKTLRDTIRKEDIVGRIGGEEFAVILPNSTLAQGLVAAESLRRNVSLVRVPTDKGQQIACTASLGITALNETDSAISQAMARADKALYCAKSEGRNRVCNG